MIARSLLIIACALIALVAWQGASDPVVMRLLSTEAAAERPPTNPKLLALCEVYAKIEPLRANLRGRPIVFSSTAAPKATESILSYLRSYAHGSTVYVDGVAETTLDYDLTLVRTGAPAGALSVTASEGRVPDVETGRSAPSPAMYQVVKVSDADGTELGRWQGMLESGCPGDVKGRNMSLGGFFMQKTLYASRTYGETKRTPPLQVDLTLAERKFVARPEDFEQPAVATGCTARLIPDDRQRKLEVATRDGAVWFRSYRAAGALPAVACSNERIAVLFRMPNRIAVVELNADGSPRFIGSVPVSSTGEREAFRDARYDGEKITAMLVRFTLDPNGRLVSDKATRVIATPPPSEAPASAFVKHTGCRAYQLDPKTTVYELPASIPLDLAVAPGQPPSALASIVVDAPARSIALSLPDVGTNAIWLIQPTPGTQLTYVEVGAKAPQTVLVAGAATVVNVATDENCLALFARDAAARGAFAISDASRDADARRVVQLLRPGTSHPYASPERTRDVLWEHGFVQAGSVSEYVRLMASMGILQAATDEDFERFRDYYYEALPVTQKVISWFSANPALETRLVHMREAYVVKRELFLPRQRGESEIGLVFFVDKGVPLPTGSLSSYRVLDANTLTCAGMDFWCPWPARGAH